MQYAHGGDIYTYKNLLDFSINVNPLGPADAVVEAAARSLQRIGEYPDSRSRELRNALAEKKGLEAERFVIGNGAADLLFSLVLAEKPQKAMIVIPAFSEYEQALKTVGCEILYHEVKKENNFRFLYDINMPIYEKIETIAKEIYGADGVEYTKEAKKSIDEFIKLGCDNMPVCMAKTQYSLSDNPALLGRPHGFKITVSSASLSNGAGFLVCQTGSVMTMPGLSKSPAAYKIDIDENGNTVGLF